MVPAAASPHGNAALILAPSGQGGAGQPARVNSDAPRRRAEDNRLDMAIRFFRDEPSSVDRSGLTGDPDIPDPPPKDRVRGIRARLRAAGPVMAGTLRGLPRMTRLVWDASPLMTAGLGGATVVSGLIPVAQAWTS